MTLAPTERPDLGGCLAEWAGGDRSRLAIARTVEVLAAAGSDLATLVRRSLLTGGGGGEEDFDELVGFNTDGDRQRRIDIAAHDLVLAALAGAPVAAVASEESTGVTVLGPGAPLVVAVDPLDGSANLAIDAPAGMIFSIRPAPTSIEAPVEAFESCFLRSGEEQLAAGFLLLGPATLLVLTVGDGTDVFVFDESASCFRRTKRGVRTPAGTREYAINASNARHWAPTVRAYVDDLTNGTNGPRQADFNMRWYGALVADAHRILTRGGVYLYPADARPDHRHGRLRLVYEAQPVAMLLEQAGGAATDGRARILSIEAAHLHARTPLVFGSADKLARVTRYDLGSPFDAERAPLFAERGLFRS